MISNVFSDKKNEEDTNESNAEELVEVEEEANDDRSETTIKHKLEAIRIVPAPDLTKEDPEHRSKTVNGPTDDIGDFTRLSSELDSSDADLLNFLEETLKSKYPLILNSLNNEKERLLAEAESDDESPPDDVFVEVKEQTPEEIEGTFSTLW